MANDDKIQDIVLKNFHESISFLTEFFGMDRPDPNTMAMYVKVLAALRTMPREAMDEVVRPILVAQFKAFGLNPHSARDRESGAAVVDLFALGIQDALSVIMQVSEQHTRSVEMLRTGRASRMLL